MSDFQMFVDGKPFGKIQNVKIKRGKDTYDSKPLKLNREISMSSCSFKMNMYTMYEMMGYKFIEDMHMLDYNQIRKHRKKRINKKWGKKYGFTVTPKKEVYLVGRNIIGHPSVIKAFRESEEAKFK